MKRTLAYPGVMLGVLLATGACAPASDGGSSEAGSTSAQWTPPALPDRGEELPDPRGVLDAAADFISSQSELLIEAEVTFGATQESGQVLHFETLQRVVLGRPDRMAWTTLKEDGTADRGWIVDGQASVIMQPANLWGSVPAGGTIADAVAHLVDRYGLDVPFQEILRSDPSARWADEAEVTLEYVGEEWLLGAWTDHIAARGPGVDFEIWVRQGDEPFIAKMNVVYVDEPGRPSYTARFRRWSNSIPADATPFEVTIPEDATRLDVTPIAEPPVEVEES